MILTISPSEFMLSVMATETLSSLPVLPELVNSAHTVVKTHRRQLDSKQSALGLNLLH